MTIASRVEEMQRGTAGRLPAEVVAQFVKDQAELDAAGTPAGAATPGAAMPDGDLLDAHGEPTTLAASTAGKPAVVVFYRGAWCPYCNVALRAYEQELVPELKARGATLVALSPQKPDGSLTMQETNELSYAVLSDPGNQIAGKLGILMPAQEDTLKAQRSLGLDVTAVNADGTATLPMPTTLVVDADGVIRWIDVHPNYTTRSEVSDILAALDSISS
ncbi:peroxiredoxin-like family protein [Kutzneria sp. CA-103260]|uniref:peroxiredoxin-like family protein n=1 Tax=Kutzneria sp. CA-103260 TaxID=2802641 RepID=UPI001BA5EB06|nr:peroxiredoxin-like family protein [Kutzneria sp. CA-103260]QUQ62525.1 peroxiredoxin-like protein [Kutzneria sp. CA-103260]